MIQPLDLSDDDTAARVIEIQRAAYRVEAELIGFDGIPPLHESVEDIRALDLLWIGSREDGVLAGIMAWRIAGRVCEIDRLAVHPTYFRRGHARALISSLDSHRRVTVSTGTKNTPARRLYESSGFVHVDEREIAPGVTVTGLQRIR